MTQDVLRLQRERQVVEHQLSELFALLSKQKQIVLVSQLQRKHAPILRMERSINRHGVINWERLRIKHLWVASFLEPFTLRLSQNVPGLKSRWAGHLLFRVLFTVNRPSGGCYPKPHRKSCMLWNGEHSGFQYRIKLPDTFLGCQGPKTV